MPAALYPTPQHGRAADEITAFFDARPATEAVLLINSCARGKATADSCLDLQVLTRTDCVAALDQDWLRFAARSPAVAELNATGRWTEVHLDIVDGEFEVRPIDHELDWLEVEVGNFLAYSVPLLERGGRLRELRAEWLPFYSDELRAVRLPAARETCLGYLDRIPWFLDRELWFQALARLHGAFAWFLLALHVKHRTYPIAYDKWIREQIVDNLKLPICTNDCRDSSRSHAWKVANSTTRRPSSVRSSTPISPERPAPAETAERDSIRQRGG
jgi:hypothetical protein